MSVFPVHPAAVTGVHREATPAPWWVRGLLVVAGTAVLGAIAVVALITMPVNARPGLGSKPTVATINASVLATAVTNYRLATGEYPSSLDDLWAMPSGMSKEKWADGPYVTNQDILTDPWGRKYILLVPGKQNADFDVVSYGADGVPGGTGDNADIVKP